jgi:hypothetical protein
MEYPSSPSDVGIVCKESLLSQVEEKSAMLLEYAGLLVDFKNSTQ